MPISAFRSEFREFKTFISNGEFLYMHMFKKVSSFDPVPCEKQTLSSFQFSFIVATLRKTYYGTNRPYWS